MQPTNGLILVASESCKDFVSALQKDVGDSLSVRPKVVDEAYFAGKVLKTFDADIEITRKRAEQIYENLLTS